MSSRCWSAFCLGWLCALSGCGGGGSSSAGRAFTQQVQEAQRLTSPSSRATRLMDIAVAQRKAQDLSGAEDTLGVARKACDAVAEPGEQAKLLARLALEYARCDNRSLARQFASAAKSVREKVPLNSTADYRAHVQALTGLSLAYHAIGETNEALQSLQQAEQLAGDMKTEKDADDLRRVQVENLIAVASSHQAIDRPEPAGQGAAKALTLAREMTKPYERVKSLAAVAALQHELKLKDAETTLDLAHKSLEEVKQPRERAHALVSIAQSLLKMGQKEQATKLLDQAERLADSAPDFRDELLTMIRKARPRE